MCALIDELCQVVIPACASSRNILCYPCIQRTAIIANYSYVPQFMESVESDQTAVNDEPTEDNQTTLMQSDYDDHADVEKNCQSRRFLCEFCEKSYAFRGNLSRHVARHHKDSQHRNICCSFCPETK